MAVCDYEYNEDIMRLKINCLGCIYGASIEDFEQWCEKTDYPYVIMESAIIYEAFLEDVFDKIILVAAPEEITMQRLIERDKTNYYEEKS